MKEEDKVWCIAPDFREQDDTPRTPWIGTIIIVRRVTVASEYYVVEGIANRANCGRDEIFLTRDQANIAYTNKMLQRIEQKGNELRKLKLNVWLAGLTDQQREGIKQSAEEPALPLQIFEENADQSGQDA